MMADNQDDMPSNASSVYCIFRVLVFLVDAPRAKAKSKAKGKASAKAKAKAA